MLGNAPTKRSLRNAAVFRYFVAALAAILGVVLRKWLTPFLGVSSLLYHTAWAAVVFSAWYCGLGPSILATLMSLAGVAYWLLPTAGSIANVARTELWGMLVFLVLSGGIIAMGEVTRRSLAKQSESEQSLRASEARLSQALGEMERRVQERTAELEQKTAQVREQARFLNSANDAIFVRTVDHHISYWNRGAERVYGWSAQEALGKQSQELLHTQFPIPLSLVTGSERWEGELRQTRRDGSQVIVVSRWTRLRDGDGNFTGWLEINTDITARKMAEGAARRLSGRILSLQDDERRRIARELHDSLGQYLVSLKFNLSLLQDGDEAKKADLISECLTTLDRCIAETRTISHLLHPPLLDEAGFASAARWYVEGFAQRSGLKVDLDLPNELGRLPRETEIALFRILQEALTNVHRHSGGSLVQVQLRIEEEQVRLSIKDDGSGIPEDRLARFREDAYSTGVGMAGMRERASELGGSLEIESSPGGTTIVVAIPFSPAADTRKAASGDPLRGAAA